jgi:hypothetical protein
MLTPEEIAESVEERILLFYVASGMDWTRVGLTGATSCMLVIKDLLGHERKSARLMLTLHGRAVLSVLLSRAGIKLSALH